MEVQAFLGNGAAPAILHLLNTILPPFTVFNITLGRVLDRRQKIIALFRITVSSHLVWTVLKCLVPQNRGGALCGTVSSSPFRTVLDPMDWESPIWFHNQLWLLALAPGDQGIMAMHGACVHTVHTRGNPSKKRGTDGITEGWQGCSKGFPKGEARGKSRGAALPARGKFCFSWLFYLDLHSI